jgi:hypothetical protein
MGIEDVVEPVEAQCRSTTLASNCLGNPMASRHIGKETRMTRALQRRGLVGGSAATLALFVASPRTAAGKTQRTKKGKKGGKGFSRLTAGKPDTFDVAANAAETGTSPCPGKSLAISGSYFLANPACQVVTVGPKDTAFSAWEVQIRCPAGEASEHNQVVAICVA